MEKIKVKGMGLFMGALGFKPPKKVFNVKNLNYRKIGPNSMQNPQRYNPLILSGYAPCKR